MDYGRIVSRSFEIAWEHKWLWIFGMFAAATGYNLKFEYLIGTSPTNPFDMSAMSNMSQIDLSAIVGTYLAFIPLAIIMGLMVIFTTGAIIDSVNRIERGGTYSFSTAFSAGIDYFFRFFGLAILFFISWMAFIIIIMIMTAVLFAIHTPLGVLAIFIFFFVTLFVLFVLTQITNIAYRVVVLRNSTIFAAIDEGFLLLKTHFGKNIAAFFIQLAFGIAFAIFTFILWLFINFPIHAAVQALNLESFPALLAALFFGMPITFLIAGYFGVFSTAFMTLFYIELVEPKPESAYFPQPPQSDNDQTGMV